MDPIRSVNPVESLGLTSQQAKTRLAAEGYNEVPGTEQKRLRQLIIDIFREPMVFLIICSGLIYLFLGDKQEAGMLLGFLGVILFITIYQEQKAEKSLQALRNLSSPRALVLRDNRKVRIPGREVVREDIVYLVEGDRVPADGKLISSLNISIDESLLTGESMPVSKSTEEAKVYSGTSVSKGSGLMYVSATGSNTALGKIGGLIQPYIAEPTRLERETRQLVTIIALIAGGLCFAVAVASILYKHSWVDGLLGGLTLAMAILPNELPAVLTIFMALGAWRLSKEKVLTRRLSAIEALGTATVLCVDKTGTLTQNQMTVRRLILDDDAFDLIINDGKSLPEHFHELLEYGLLAAEQNAFDPIDRAFNNAAVALLSGSDHIHPNWTLTRQYPLSPELLALSQVWHSGGDGPFPVGAKGAPEAIVDLCHLPDATRNQIAQRVKAHADLGLRILAVAKGKVYYGKMPEHQHDVDFEFLGLIGLEDPLRAEVPAAIAECNRAGIRVIMITGDHPDTARSIAKQAGLPNPDQVLTGTELGSLTNEQLGKRIQNTSVCARMMPEQKCQLIDILKAQGEIVAMTGDGINDAPALKKANIGIAMGKRGTDVAREAAAIVLLEDDFGSIVNAVKIGRRIYANLQHAMSYLLAVHISIAGLSVIPVLMNMPLILLPVHIAFLHLIIEPACSVAFEAEPESHDIMGKPPRRPESRLFSRAIIIPTFIQGISVLAILILTYVGAWKWGDGATDARTMAFTILVLANIGLIMASLKVDGSNLLQRKAANHALRWVICASIGLLLLVLYVPTLRNLFRFTKLHPGDILLCLLAGSLSSLWFSLSQKNTASVETYGRMVCNADTKNKANTD